MPRFIALFLFLCLTSLPAGAQDAPLLSLQSAQDGRGWDGVGRLDIEGKGFCTASLIREDIVLTAAHCVFEPAGLIAADRFTFNAGLRQGRAEAYRQVRRVVVHPDYRFRSGDITTEVALDLALLQLDRPIRTTRIKPFAVSIATRTGEDVGVVSYAHGRETAPSLQDMCSVLAQEGNILIMSCQVTYGASGSPVFRLSGPQPQMVSIVSAMSDLNNQPVSLGTAFATALPDLLDILDAAALGLPNGITPGQRNETGAKFIRPGGG